jgi:glycogen phosphorylase
MFKTTDTIAYFSMEVGLDSAIPTYSGGLGVLAGDTLRAAADLGLPLVAVTLLHRQGYFRQHLDAAGNQSESPVVWCPEEVLEALSPRVAVAIEGGLVRVCAWRYLVRGVFGHIVPVYFLDTAVEENSPWSQSLTDRLYGGDLRYRLCQEVVLGLGGVAMLRALGYDRIQPYHMNEGHAALLTLALLEQQAAGGGLHAVTEVDVEAVRQRCVFTTHTPAPAGHDRFPLDLVRQVLGGGAERRPGGGSRLPEEHAGHDIPRPLFFALCQWRCHAPRRGLTWHVSPLSNQRDHQRRPRRHLDGHAVS